MYSASIAIAMFKRMMQEITTFAVGPNLHEGAQQGIKGSEISGECTDSG